MKLNHNLVNDLINNIEIKIPVHSKISQRSPDIPFSYIKERVQNQSNIVQIHSSIHFKTPSTMLNVLPPNKP